MAASDATPLPIKNQAYRVTLPIYDQEGDLVTGAAGLDSEISKDGGTFADCTSEATEIATASGIYFLDLTATEMNADTVAIIVKTSTTGAKTSVIVMYPTEATDIPVNVAGMNANTLTASALATDAVTEIQSGLAFASALTTVGGNVSSVLANTDVAISTRLAASSYVSPPSAASISSAVWSETTRTLTGFGTLVADIWSAGTRLLTAGTNIVLAKGVGVTGFNDVSAAQVNAEVLDVLAVDTFAEPSSVPAATSTFRDMVHWLFTLARNKRTTTATVDTLRNDADSGSIATAAVSDDGTTFTRNEYI